MKKFFALFIAVALLVCLMAGCGKAAPETPTEASQSSQTADTPSSTAFEEPKSLEFICCYGAGGGHDVMLRSMEMAWRANDIYNGNIAYNYQNGGAQAVGMTYTMEQRGRNDCLMSTTMQLVKTPLLTDLGFTWRDMKPLIIWGDTSQFMIVRADLGVESVEEFMTLDMPLTIADAGPGSSSNFITTKLKACFPDADVVNVSFDGDAEILSQLLGGHIEATFTDLGSVREYLVGTGTGELQVLAVANGKRSMYMPEIPTLIELGYDIENMAIRGIVAPPDMDPEYAEYWTEKLVALLETEEFKQYYADNTLEVAPVYGEDLIPYLEKLEEWQIDSYKTAGIEMLPQYN